MLKTMALKTLSKASIGRSIAEEMPQKANANWWSAVEEALNSCRHELKIAAGSSRSAQSRMCCLSVGTTNLPRSQNIWSLFCNNFQFSDDDYHEHHQSTSCTSVPSISSFSDHKLCLGIESKADHRDLLCTAIHSYRSQVIVTTKSHFCQQLGGLEHAHAQVLQIVKREPQSQIR